MGATAIEDKLQDGVPETIAKLANVSTTMITFILCDIIYLRLVSRYGY